jgi:antitoxin CptB
MDDAAGLPMLPDPIPDPRRRRLVFRAWHRGTREMDLVMGRFTEAQVAAMTDDEVGDLERLMEANDRDVFDWVSGMAPVPANYDTPVFRRLRAFHLTPTV